MLSRLTIATRLRLASGLVLMTFVAGHLINHALALHSLETVEDGKAIFAAIWRSPPGTILLYGSLLTHITLTLFKLFQRRRLRMPLWEMAQIGLGLAIPFWLVLHVIGTRGAHEILGVNDSYLLQFAGVWPENAGRQTLMLLLVWLHGCIGLHFWLRIRGWYADVRPFLLAVAILLPGLALAGFHLGGREVQAIAAHDPSWIDRIAAEQNCLTKRNGPGSLRQNGACSASSSFCSPGSSPPGWSATCVSARQDACSFAISTAPPLRSNPA